MGSGGEATNYARKSNNNCRPKNALTASTTPKDVSSPPATTTHPSSFSVWWTAIRPHTLTASISPCLVGAYYSLSAQNSFPYLSFSLWIFFCFLIQIGTNLHNDVSDYIQGADNKDRIGQPRAVQRGWISPLQMFRVCCGVLMVAFLVGMLIIVNILEEVQHWFVFVVLTSIFNAFMYTGGPWSPLGYLFGWNFSLAYSGWAEIVCFLYFGVVATITVPCIDIMKKEQSVVQDDETNGNNKLVLLCLYAVQMGCFASSILVVNNLRDRKTDALAGKNTLIVQFGPTFGKWEYTSLVLLSYLLVFMNAYFTHQNYNFEDTSTLVSTILKKSLPLASLPMAMKQIHAIHTKDGPTLNKHLGLTALLQLLFSILVCVELSLTKI